MASSPRLSAKQLQSLLSRQKSLLSGSEAKPSRLHSHMLKAPEKDIQAAILAYLERCSFVAWANRMNTGTMRKESAAGVRWIKFGFVGCPDIMGQLTDGRFLAVECKSSTGTASIEQINFLQCVNAANGVGIVARSVDDVIDALRQAKQQRK